MNEISQKVLRYIYDKTVGDDDNPELSAHISNKDLADYLQVNVNIISKTIEYLFDKNFIRATKVEVTNKKKPQTYYVITSLGIDAIEENL